jgi:hypothetical protein
MPWAAFSLWLSHTIIVARDSHQGRGFDGESIRETDFMVTEMVTNAL